MKIVRTARAFPRRSRRLARDVSQVVTRHDALGRRLHTQAGCADWLGERLDLGWAIDVRHPTARNSATIMAAGPPPIGK